MTLLLDTHALLWFLADDPRLSASARTTIEDPANPRLLSPVSLQEIAIKMQLGKLRLDEPFAVVFPAQLTLNLKQVLHRSRPAAGLCGSLDVSLGEPAAELWCETPLAVR